MVTDIRVDGVMGGVLGMLHHTIKITIIGGLIAATSACVTPYEQAQIANDIEATPVDFTTDTSERDTSGNAKKIISGRSRSTDRSIAPQNVQLFCGACEAEKDDLQFDLEEAESDIKDLEAKIEVMENAYSNVEATWVKRSLRFLGKYDDAEVKKAGGFAKIFENSYYDDVTVKAARRFQCDYYGVVSETLCNRDPRATGWLTFPEARAAICHSGYRAVDDTATLLAGWYAYGRVFEQDLPRAWWLLAKAQKELAPLINDSEGDEQAFFLTVESNVRQLKSFIDKLIETDVNARDDLTDDEKDALESELYGDVNANHSQDEICPREF